MDESTLRVLEFDKIIARLASLAHFSAGREKCEAARPITDVRQLTKLQAETSEARGVLRQGSSVPFGGVSDIRGISERASIGAVLAPDELLRVADLILGARKIKKFLTELRTDFVLMREKAQQISVPSEVENAIRRAIADNATVLDDASPELARIRRSLRLLQSRIRDRLESLVRSPEAQRYLQEPIITMRNGRFVVPVKAEFRSSLPGIVHDQSQSGATLFIEPMASVEANNELRKLELEQRDEIERVLTALSAEVGSVSEVLETTVEVLADLDFCFARARLSIEMEASEPLLSRDYRIDIRRARHPLLTGDVVPVDVRLGHDFDTLVITGPNTGGKTVTLKTVGLLTLMAQAGLHVPAAPNSRLSVFEKVFCDIGDEQSIEQSLSTFSSHMRNVVVIVDQAGVGSLVLLDEIGAGTDPEEGSRLAMALLEHLHSRGARTVATTHYSELKSFAYTRERMSNASVEFDVETLRPTFRLSIGLPGKSNAFLIAQRLGLDPLVIARARELMSDEHIQVEDLIAQIQASKSAAIEESQKAYQARVRAAQLEEEYSRKLRELRQREREIHEKARQQALSLLARVRAQCDEALKLAKSAAQEPQAQLALQKELRQALRQAREIVEQSSDLDTPAASVKPIEPKDVIKGKHVFIKSLSQTGEVIDGPDAQQNVTVRVGIIRTQVKLADLVAAEPEERRIARENLGRLMADKAQHVSPEISLRGMTSDEAVEALDKYIDDALLSGLGQVRVIHGKGTGALRKAVQERLRAHPSVVSFRFGEASEGGDGATIVTLSR